MRKGRINRLSTMAQHHTLICELDSGEGGGNSFDVQSFDDRGAPVSSCYDDFSRGFEFGGHEYTWSLQAGIRQPSAMQEVAITAIDVDKRTNEVYMTGTILGACAEGYSGCFGVLGSHLPDRGRSAAGDFNPLFLDPYGTTSSFVMKLNRYGNPMWLTMMDSQSQFGRVQASALVVDSTSSPAHVYVGGNYLTTTGAVVRFWHVNERTKRPTRISREEVDRGGGSCNQVACSEGICTNTMPAGDEFKCADRSGGFQDSDTCRISRCAYIMGYESRDEQQDDAWLAEISKEGRWLWTKLRLGMSRRGFTIKGGSVQLATTLSGYGVPLAESSSAVYMTATLQIKPHSFADLKFHLGNVAHEFYGLDVDEEDLDILSISVPPSEEWTRFGFIARFSNGGVLWSRRIGPLGKTGELLRLQTDGTNIYLVGNYLNTSLGIPFYDSCAFGHPGHDLDASASWQHSTSGHPKLGLPLFTNSLCFPFAMMHSRYTMASWERTTPQQWDDISGNNRHATTSRGTVSVGWRAPSNGADTFQVYLYGTKRDGMRFPEGSIPEHFTICSVSRMSEMSEGSILQSADLMNWAHGHYGGHPGQAWYGTLNFQTDTGQDASGTHSWGDHAIRFDDWIIMCGQNAETDSLFLANGVNTGISSGGNGGGMLSINHGNVALLRGYADWEILEVAIWDMFLSSHEMRSVMMYYQDLLRSGSKTQAPNTALPTEGVKNMFLASYTPDGQLRWHREAVGGNVTTTALALSEANLTRRGVDLATNLRVADQEEAGQSYVYVAGNVHGETTPADFGVARFPEDCSSGKMLGQHTFQPITIGKGCADKVDSPLSWRSSSNATCRDYADNRWCLNGGKTFCPFFPSVPILTKSPVLSDSIPHKQIMALCGTFGPLASSLGTRILMDWMREKPAVSAEEAAGKSEKQLTVRPAADRSSHGTCVACLHLPPTFQNSYPSG